MRAMAVDALGGVDRLALRELPRPEPAADEVLIRVATVGINRQDLITMVGRFPNPHLRLPHVPGIDPAGSVEDVGADVTRVAVGDRVVVKPPISCGVCELCLAGEDDACPDLRSVGVHRQGGLAEYVAVPERNVFRIPAGVTFGEATVFAHSFPVALTLLRRVGVTERDTLLVPGASGSVGSAIVQLASVIGARVVAAVGGRAHADIVGQLDPFAVIDYVETPTFSSLVRELVPGGVTVHVETSSDPALWTESLACLARRGRVAVIGAHAGPVVQLDLNWLFRQRASIVGCSGSNLAAFGDALELLGEGRLTVPIDQVVSLTEAPAAYRRLMGRDHHGKTIVDLALTT